jgi:hypothetical protein
MWFVISALVIWGWIVPLFDKLLSLNYLPAPIAHRDNLSRSGVVVFFSVAASALALPVWKSAIRTDPTPLLLHAINTWGNKLERRLDRLEHQPSGPKAKEAPDVRYRLTLDADHLLAPGGVTGAQPLTVDGLMRVQVWLHNLTEPPAQIQDIQGQFWIAGAKIVRANRNPSSTISTSTLLAHYYDFEVRLLLNRADFHGDSVT